MSTRGRRIAFLQTIPFELIGVQSLAAVLKDHEVEVIITYIDSCPRIVRKLTRFRPDFLCFTSNTSDHHYLLSLAQKLKETFGIPYIWGGPHATFFPEIIEEPGVDIAVRGEAEHILPGLIDDIADTTRRSCSFKLADGTIIRNEMGRLIHDLDSLPFPDRSLYRRYYRSLPYSSLPMVAGRGCPFNCSFCYNRTLKKIFSEDLRAGRYVRLRSPERVVAEIEQYIRDFGRPRYVKFYDDTLIFDRKWVLGFMDLYRRRIGIPFTCLGRADLVDEEIVKAMKDAGIACFLWAVETGNERLRKEVLKKNISNEQIVRCGEMLNRHKILFRTYNMMGIPGETWEDALSTADLNRRIRNPLPLCTIYDPYPGTELAEVAEKAGLLEGPLHSKNYTKIQYATSLLKIDPRILRVQMLFFCLVRFPFLERFLRKWILADHRIINQLLFYPGYGYVFWRSYKHTFREMLLIIWRTYRPLVGLETGKVRAS